MAVARVFPPLPFLNFTEFADIVLRNPDVKTWLRANEIIAANQACGACGSPMAEGRKASNVDRVVWRCPVRGCRNTHNIRTGSFFRTLQTTLDTMMTVLYMWSQEEPNNNIERHTALCDKTLAQILQYIRDICSWDLVNHPRMIGGIGHTVAIDESVVARRKPGNAQGRPVREQWVFGGVDIATKEFFMVLVPRRDAATLFPFIQANIVPGTTIWSDGWAAYAGLPNIGYQHAVVNHTLWYVDPVTGVHTQHIESRWNAIKRTLKEKCGVRREHLSAYLDEYMWKKNRPRERLFGDIVDAIRRNFPF